MKVVTAIEEYERKSGDIFCFLAGGITDCAEWQDAVIEKLQEKSSELEHLVVFNPRRKDFPINDPHAAEEQIDWEFRYLEQADIFSMYFAHSEKSVQPICMYELGRNIARMQMRHPNSFLNRLVIGCEEDYSRKNDVVIQSSLAIGMDRVNDDTNPFDHADSIIWCYKKLKGEVTRG